VIGWLPDGAGIRPGGDVAEGIPGFLSYSAWFRHPELPNAVVIRTAYAAADAGAGNRDLFTVQVRTEWIVCSDPERPRETETGRARDDYDDWDRLWNTAAEAEADARDRVAGDLLRNAYCYDWDGEPAVAR
jgi:hypothetical protein